MNGVSPSRRSQEASALSSRLFIASLACAELITVYIGLRLGLYGRLSAAPATPLQLAQDAGIDLRYAREWLEQQAVAGILKVSGIDRAADDRIYRLPRGHAEALLDPDSPASVAPLALLPAGGMTRVLPDLLSAFRTGAGVPYAAYGEDLRGGGSGLNRPVFMHHLADWVRTVLPDVHERLQRGEARIADVACGAGWSTIVLARAYPHAEVVGIDADAASIEEAQRNVGSCGLGDRIELRASDVASALDGRRCQLVCVFDALHDMSRPVEALRACRTLLTPDGCILLMEPRVHDAFTAPADEMERFMYAISVLHCLPVGLADQPSVGTGTVMRTATVEEYARQAGFASVTVLDVEHRFHRLYRLDVENRSNGAEVPATAL